MSFPGSGGHFEPLFEVRLFDAGEGDPRVTDHGLNWFDNLFDSNQFGQSSRNSKNEELLEWLDGIGLTNRGFFAAQDTFLVYWDILGGSWAERKPATGRYRNTRLNQYDSASSVQWGLRGRVYLEQNAARVISLQLPDTPPDFDFGTIEPFVRFEIGSGLTRFAIRLDKDGRCSLQLWSPAVNDFVFARDLPAPVKSAGYSDAEECFIGFKVKAGRLGVSTDMGHEWNWWPDPKTRRPFDAPIVLPSGKPVIRGAGGEINFGLHKLPESDGEWTAAAQPTLTSTLFGTALFDSRYAAPSGAEIDFTDLSATFTATAQYKAKLRVNSEGQGPVLYWTLFRYLTQATAGTATFTTPWTGSSASGSWVAGTSFPHGRLTGLRIEAREALRDVSCTLNLKLAPGDTPISALRRRKVAVFIHFREWHPDGTHTDHLSADPEFTGYIGSKETSQPEFGGCTQTITAQGAAKWTRPKWSVQDVRPLGGRPVNDAADLVLNSEGIDGLNLPLYRTWDSLGDAFILDLGLPEQPFELIKAGEDKWTTLERLFGYPEMELGVDAYAKLFTLRKNPSGVPATTGVFHDYRATETDDLSKLAQTVASRTDYDRSATAVMLSGKSQIDGSTLRAYGVDLEAETDQSSDRYCPWRELEQEEISDPCSPGLLAYRTGEKAYDLFPLRIEPEVGAFLNLAVGRRDVLRIYGAAEQGIADATQCIVMTKTHVGQVALDDGRSTLDSTFGLYLPPQ